MNEKWFTGEQIIEIMKVCKIAQVQIAAYSTILAGVALLGQKHQDGFWVLVDPVKELDFLVVRSPANYIIKNPSSRSTCGRRSQTHTPARRSQGESHDGMPGSRTTQPWQ